MKTGDFLNTLAGKLGLQNDSHLVSLLSKADFSQVDIADDLANQICKGLLSLDGAKNSAEVMNHFKPTLLKAIDDRFAIIAEELGISDQIAAEKSTYKKSDLLKEAYGRKIADLEAKVKAGAGNQSEEVTKLTAQIADLQKQLGAAGDKAKADAAAMKQAHQKEILDMLISQNLTGQNYANEQVSKDINVMTAKSLLTAKLAEAKAILINEGGVAKLKQAENPTLDYLDAEMKPVSFADFTTKMLADAHLLKVSAPNPQPQQQHGGFVPPVITPQGGSQQNANFASAVAASLGDLTQQH